MSEKYECAISMLMDELLETCHYDAFGWGNIVTPSPAGQLALCESPYPNSVEIATMDAVERGGGKHALKLLSQAADKLGLTLTVLAHPLDTHWRRKTSLETLIAFYEAEGFVRDTGRDEAWNFMSAHMVRHPRPRET